jgi:hypothetical protein
VILSEVFQISSLGTLFSSLGILQTSDEIEIFSDKIGAFSPFPHFLFKKEEKERGKNTRSFSRMKKNVVIFGLAI